MKRSTNSRSMVLAMVLAVGSVWTLGGCATTTTTTVLSLSGASCAGCGMGSVSTLRKVPGVRSATFDQDRAEVTVVHEPEAVSVDALVAALDGEEFKVLVGAGQGSYAEAPVFAEGLDVTWINEAGSDVDYEQERVAGKVTVIDFFAEWCGPCKDVDRAMVKVLEARPDVALRKIDVKDWDSPVAKARLKGIKSLPYVIVYGPDGARRDAISGKDLPRLIAAIGTPPAPAQAQAP